MTDKTGESPLIVAARKRNSACVEWLLRTGVEASQERAVVNQGGAGQNQSGYYVNQEGVDVNQQISHVYQGADANQDGADVNQEGVDVNRHLSHASQVFSVVRMIKSLCYPYPLL